MKSKKKVFKWVLEIEVDETWVADGYEATAERVKEAILSYSLGYAYEDEVKVKLLKKPLKRDIDKAQGYKRTSTKVCPKTNRCLKE